MSQPQSAQAAALPPDDLDAAVIVRDLTANDGGHEVLHGVNLTVPSGQVFALLGPKDAGKTALIEILEGYRRRSGGEVQVLGADPQRANAAWRARIGVVMNSWLDHPHWRVGELTGHLAGYYQNPYPPTELLDLVGLSDQANETLIKLSTEQRHRLDLALGVIGRPELLLLDEPTAGLEPDARTEFWELITKLRRPDMTIILAAEDPAEAAQLADHAAVLSEGNVLAVGTPAELTEPATTSTRDDQ